MKRRQVIYNILLAFGIVIVAGNYKWLFRKAVPNLEFLLSENKLLIAELAETIIPATETPGARDAKVEDFIIKIIINCSDVMQQQNFINGLNEVQNFSKRTYHKPFEKCSKMEKIKTLEHFENSERSSYMIVNQVKRKLFGAPFFSMLKSLTVIGYCTSEPGATKGLEYVYVPRTYQACVSLLPGQKSWATR